MDPHGQAPKEGRRTKTGRLSRAFTGPARDEGTRELQRHRLCPVNGAHDPALSSSLAGIMFAHGILSSRQHAAAQRYRMPRSALYGVPLATVSPVTRSRTRIGWPLRSVTLTGSCAG
jgi:hypothetical protein